MKTTFLLLIVFVAVPVLAQTPRAEVFVGGSGFRSGSTDFAGGIAETTVNLTKHLGVVVDGGVQRLPVSGIIYYNVQALSGVQYGWHWHWHRFSPFTHGLAGYSRAGFGPVRQCCDASGGAFTVPGREGGGYAAAVGGGADLSLIRVLALRAVMDWMPEHDLELSHVLGGSRPWVMNSYRIGAGIVLRFGGVGHHEARYRDLKPVLDAGD